MQAIIKRFKKYNFLFEELVKRDFKRRYSRTTLGILWSLISPLAILAIQAIVFQYLLRFNIPHFIIYMCCGNLVFNYFSESTTNGMRVLAENSNIFTKINVPKYLFLFSRNIAAFINFTITLGILFLFVFIEGLPFTWKFLMLLYPIGCLIIFNIGVGLILSAGYMFFRDLGHLYDIFKTMLMYFSAIFYSVDRIDEGLRWVFYLNPIFVYIRYFRKIIIEQAIPAPSFHALAAFYALAAFTIGAVIYYKQNYKFLYYV